LQDCWQTEKWLGFFSGPTIGGKQAPEEPTSMQNLLSKHYSKQKGTI